MKNIRVLCVMAIFCFPGGAQELLHLEGRSAKPLKDICTDLAGRLNWRVSYEEPPVLAEDELEGETLPSGVWRKVMRAVPVSVDTTLADRSSAESKIAVMKTILDAYHHSGNRAEFRNVQKGDFIHVVPVSVRGPDGKLRPFQPMLDTPVTIPMANYNLGALIDMIMTRVSQKRGIPILRATVPLNLFAQTWVTDGAYDEPARDVLVRVFEEINAPRLADNLSLLRLTWHLNYNPNGSNYFMNVHNVLPEERSVVPKGEEPAARTEQPIEGTGKSKFGGKRR